MKSRKWLPRASFFCVSVLICTGAAALIGSSSMGRWMELRTYDLRFRLRGPLPQSKTAPVTLLAIDEASLTNIREPLMLWHAVFARVIDYLVSKRAAVIGVDFVFADIRRFDPEGERLLSASLFQAGAASVPIVLAYRIRPDGVEQPTESVRLAAFAAGHSLGYANLTTDIDDFVRRQQIFARGEGGEIQQGFALAIAEAFARKRQLPLEPPGSSEPTILIDYRGAGHFKRISFDRIFQSAGSANPSPDEPDIRDHIVLIGRVGQAGDEDLHSTPQYFMSAAPARGDSIRTPGVEIHANVITTLLERKPFRTLAPFRQLALTLALIALVSFVCFRFSPAFALPLCTVGILGYLALAGLTAFNRGWWVLLVSPLSGAVLAIGSAEIVNYILEGREKRRLRNLFKRYVNDEVIERILQSPGGLSLAGEKRRVSVLFADIRGFTTRSEGNSAEALVRDLNEYFTVMVTVIQDHNGMVDKFIGDGLMAIFGAPMDDPDAALHSVQAAQSMSVALREVNRRLEARGAQPISIGIGIHTGEAVLGNIGSPQKMEYTAIGDVVNVASRIEGLNRNYGSEILVSGDTYEATRNMVAATLLGQETVKGRIRPVLIYEVKAEKAAQ